MSLCPIIAPSICFLTCQVSQRFIHSRIGNHSTKRVETSSKRPTCNQLHKVGELLQLLCLFGGSTRTQGTSGGTSGALGVTAVPLVPTAAPTRTLPLCPAPTTVRTAPTVPAVPLGRELTALHLRLQLALQRIFDLTIGTLIGIIAT